MTESLSAQSDPHLSRDSCDPSAALPGPSVLGRLYDQYAGELAGYLRKAFGDGPPDPEDIAQDAFRKLAEIDDLSDIKHPRAFLWRIARNLMVSGKRHEDIRSKYDFEIEHLFFALDGTESSPENVLQVKQQLSIIYEVLAEMPENRRLAFLLHRVDGLNLSAVGRQLGMTRTGAVKHVARAALDIKAALKNSTAQEC